jgi:drug/metabolite transporter (DMT)-like permease
VTSKANVWRGMLYGFMGIACFSLTPPLSKIALNGFSPYFLTAGRVAVAGLLAALILYMRGEAWPERTHWKKLVLVSLGVSVGFPLCLSMALMNTESAHAGIVLAILPLLTSVLGAWMHKEKHVLAYWFVAISGCITVLAYTFWKSGITLAAADAWLLGAALSASIAYNVGGSLSKKIGGINTICWALVFILPLSVPMALLLYAYAQPISTIPISALFAFLYLAVVSQLFGFVPWYAGLSLGGVARVSQVQLLQTFLTLFASSLLLGEVIDIYAWLVSVLVVAQIYLAKKLA